MKKLILTLTLIFVFLSSLLMLLSGIFDIDIPKPIRLLWAVCCLVSAAYNFYNLYPRKCQNNKDE